MFLDCIGKISWWAEVLKLPKCKIHLNHTFQKQSSLSQYQIVGPNGVLKLSVPTIKSSRKGPYSEVKISQDIPWQREHWKSIVNAYTKAPFFQFYDYKLEHLFNQKFDLLLEFNRLFAETVLNLIKADTSFEYEKLEDVYFVESENQKTPEYPQVYDLKLGFKSDVCILDLLFNLGPETKDYLLLQSSYPSH